VQADRSDDDCCRGWRIELGGVKGQVRPSVIVYLFYPITVCERGVLCIPDALSERTQEAGRRSYDDRLCFPPLASPPSSASPTDCPFLRPRRGRLLPYCITGSL
jgi:hypothetical protein